MTSKRGRNPQGNKPMLFSPLNYKLLGLGVFLIVAGFSAMYMENEVYGFISLYISPIIILSGYVTVLISILKQPDKSAGPQSS